MVDPFFIRTFLIQDSDILFTTPLSSRHDLSVERLHVVKPIPRLLGFVSAILTISSFCSFVMDGGLPGGDLDSSPSSPDSLNLFTQSLTVCLFNRSFEATSLTPILFADSSTIDALTRPVKFFDGHIEESLARSSTVGALTYSGLPMTC